MNPDSTAFTLFLVQCLSNEELVSEFYRLHPTRSPIEALIDKTTGNPVNQNELDAVAFIRFCEDVWSRVPQDVRQGL